MKKKNFFKLVEEVKNLCSSEDNKKKLLLDPKKTLKEAKIEFPNDMELKFLENSKNTYNFVVPIEEIPEKLRINNLSTKPSYQEIGLWMIHQIQSNSELKDRILKEPTKVLKEKKIDLAKDLTIKIHCNTEKKMYFVLPRKMSSSEELTDAEMQAVAGGAGGFFGSSSMFSTGGQHMGSQSTHQTSKGADTTVDAAYGPQLGGGGGGGGGAGGAIGDILGGLFG